MAFSTIDKSTDYQNGVLYTGTGSGATVSGVGFQPDLNWTKQRDGTESFYLVDSVRGVTKTMYSNDTSAEDTYANGLTAFNSDGYVHGDHQGYATSAKTYVSWNWKAGTTSGLSGGTITPTSYSINTTSGFGIYKYTGTGSAGTIAHGLGVAPAMVITKGFDAASKSWCVGQDYIAWTKELFLNVTDAEATTSGAWNDTDPTDTLITLGTGGNGNSSGVNYVMYAWTPISGFSKFSGYTGNGNADGAFIYTGFKPSFVIIKKTNTADSWAMFDNKRLGYNNYNYRLRAETSAVEYAGTNLIDIVSNGFKVRTADGELNFDASTYLYMAFGQPIISNSGVCATAR